LEFGFVIELEPALGIEVESPQRCGAIAEHREDLKRIARPEGERPRNV
jgi:hypothetical protein